MAEEKIGVKAGSRFVILSLTILLIGFGGINSGYNAVILFFSLLLATLGTSGVFSRWNLKGLHLEASPPERVFCCQEAIFKIKIENRTRIPKFALNIDAAGENTFLGDLPPSGHLSLPRSFTFQRRGFNPIPDIVLFSRFPLGLVTRRKNFSFKEPVLVYPKVYEVYPHFPEEFSGEGTLSLKRRGTEELAWIRENPEAELRRVDWKAFARTGKLVEKVFASNSGRKIIIVLDPMGSGRKFEQNISLVASVGIYLMKNGVDHLMIGGRFRGRVTEKTVDEFLRALALIKPGSEEDSRALARQILKEFPGYSFFAAVTVPTSPLVEILKPKEMVFV